MARKIKQTSCNYCNKDIQDGEFISLTEDDTPYHSMGFKEVREPMTCNIAQVIKTNSVGIYPEIGIYYKGKLYDHDDVRKLSNISEIKVGLNDHKNGQRAIGDLSGLVN